MRIILALVPALLLQTNAMSQEEKEEAQEPTFVAVAKNDPEIAKAIEEARSSIDFFLKIYEEHKENIGVYFAIKVPIQDGDTTAHVWYTFQGYEGDLLKGEHFELPKELMDHKSIRIKREEIEDWMINDHGNLYGGFSIRVMRSRTPEDERAKYDEYVGVSEYKELF